MVPTWPVGGAVEVLIFGTATAGLAAAGHPVWASVFAALVVVNRALMFCGGSESATPRVCFLPRRVQWGTRPRAPTIPVGEGTRGMPRTNPRYGWTPDLPDHRDILYAAPPDMLQALPPAVDLRPQCPPVVDQGQLGSCTANALAGAVEFTQMKERLTAVFPPSRLFIYYNERVIEGTVDSDSGAQIRDGIKAVAKQGVCPEAEWPYDIAKFTDPPPPVCYQTAMAHRVVRYQRIAQLLNQMKGCLASGYPFVFGFTVYESFESPQVAQTGHAPLPNSGESVVGGHAVPAVGYDDAQQWFICRNSWGTGWGMQGYFTLPYTYLAQRELAADFWTIRLVQ